MGNITIRRLDDAIIEQLKARAQAKGRSLEAEMRDLLAYIAQQPLILDPLVEADRIAAMTPAGISQTDSRLLASAGNEP
jgi:plasmid stability protein